MFDFWLTMGSIAIDPTFLTSLDAAISGSTAKFTPATASVTVSTTTTTLKAAGTFSDNGAAVTVLRGALQTQLNNRFPGANITVSLYTAGKTTQLMAVDSNTVKSVSTALAAAMKAAATIAGSPVFGCRDAAFIGACLIDDGLLAALTAGGLSAQDTFFTSPVTSPQWKFVSALIADPNFKTANQTLSPSATWDFGCFQRFTFYPKFQMIAN